MMFLETPLKENLCIFLNFRSFPSIINDRKERSRKSGKGKTVVYLQNFLKCFAIYYFYFAFSFGIVLYGQLIFYLERFANASAIIDYGFFFQAAGGLLGSGLAPRIITLYTENEIFKGKGMNYLIISIGVISIVSRVLAVTIPHFFFLSLLTFSNENQPFNDIGVIGCSWVWGEPKRFITFGFYVMYPLGTFMAPAVTSVVFDMNLSDNMTLQIPFFLAALLLLTALIPLLMFSNPSPAYQQKHSLSSAPRFKSPSTEVSKHSKKSSCLEKVKGCVCTHLRSSLTFSNLVYLVPMIMVNLSQGICVYSFDNLLFTYISKGMGYSDSQASMISSIYSFANFVGRITSVFLSNVLSSPQYMAFDFIGGIWATALMWFFGQYSMIITIIGVSVNGFCVSSQIGCYYNFIFDIFGFPLSSTGVSYIGFACSVGFLYPSVLLMLMKNVTWHMFVISIFVSYVILFTAVCLTVIWGKLYHLDKNKICAFCQKRKDLGGSGEDNINIVED